MIVFAFLTSFAEKVQAFPVTSAVQVRCFFESESREELPTSQQESVVQLPPCGEVAARDFESIPRSNEALAFLELEQYDRAEQRARIIVGRDPNFVDARALLATIRFSQEDLKGAAAEMYALCDSPPGAELCDRYSRVDIVLGRWPPRAVAAYRAMLRAPAVERVFQNAKALSR